MKKNEVEVIGSENQECEQATFKCHYISDDPTNPTNKESIVGGEFRDDLGNVFKPKKPEPDEIRGIQEFIDAHFHEPHRTNLLTKMAENVKDKEIGVPIPQGKFIKGRLHGWGEVQYKGGDIYRGMFKDGKRSGYGSMVINQFQDINDYELQ